MKYRHIWQNFKDKCQLSRIKSVMKVSVLFLTGILLSITTMAYPQRVTISLKNAPLKTFFEELQKQVDVALLFSENSIYQKKISIDEKDIQLKTLLSRELPKHDLAFIEFNGQITIVPNDTKPKNIEKEKDIQDQVTVKGRIFDTSEPPMALSNVNISTDGGRIVGVTDEAGYYDVSVLRGTNLVFSAVGYHTREVLITKPENNLTISLTEDVSDMEEVVVVGMTEMQRKHIASSVASLDVGSNIEGKPITNLSQSLQGGVTGLSVQQGSGLPGGDAATIKIRGISTLNNADPLVLVDGVPMDMNHIDPVTVESVTILKDAAAAAIYGARAANGVILVTTKRGKAGQINVLYDGYY